MNSASLFLGVSKSQHFLFSARSPEVSFSMFSHSGIRLQVDQHFKPALSLKDSVPFTPIL